MLFLQQTEKELVPLPDGQFLHLRLLHPLQFSLGAGIAPYHLALPPVGGVQVDELGHVAPNKGQQAPGAEALQSQASLLLHFPQQTVLRAFKPLKLSAYTDPFVVVVVVLLFDAVQHQISVLPLQIAKSRAEDGKFRVHKCA